MIRLEQQRDKETLYLYAHGRWELEQLPNIRSLLSTIPDEPSAFVLDVKQAERLDVSSAWLIYNHLTSLQQQGKTVSFRHLPEEYLLYFAAETFPDDVTSKVPAWRQAVINLGKKSAQTLQLLYSAIAFFGQSLTALTHIVIAPGHLRFRAMLHHMFTTGISAIPIVAMVATLISIVITYQGGGQLRELGATIYTVDMVAISVLRELGVLLTAIVVAGRSGSAFAAEIGLMKTNQEVDALMVMGSNPFIVLVLPRMLALLITLPLLTLIADMLALLAAAAIAPLLLDISFSQFFTRVEYSVGLSTFLAGLIKAPFFALVIAWVGCWQGMQVSGSSESLGEHTTNAVVQSILLILLLDALFSILFYQLGF